MKHLRLSLVIASLSTLFFTQSSYAAAFQLYELGTPIIGTAGVGQAAIASDASTTYFNPAGMTALPSSELLLGSQVILPYANFSSNNTTTISGNNGGNAGLLTPALGGYYVYSFSPKVKMGISLTSPYGGAFNYNNHWVGRYVVQQLYFYTLNFNPTVAYQLNHWLSLGAGVSVEYANLNQSVALSVVPLIDGQATVKVSSTAPGFNLGALLTPTDSTRVGVAFRSQIVHNFTGNIDFLNFSATPRVTTKMVMPANVIASVTQNITDKFKLLGELGWANWSSMVNTVVNVHGFSSTTPQNWHDTYRVGLGGQYQYISSLLFQGGISYDSSPTSTLRRTPNLPMDKQVRVGAGIQYAMVKAVMLGLSYEYINLGSAHINNTSSNGIFAGSYSRNYANVFQASLNVGC